MFDYELDSVTVEFNAGNAAKFINFDEETLTISIKEGATTNRTQPLFTLKMNLTDDHFEDHRSIIYFIKLVILPNALAPVQEVI